ncbi:glycosyltransferase family 4 protein [Candidatus Eisenbacteria bacterium]|uniref:Glycosyltransferase family 4 protein n=1 Tax=Eiseniibacteriota bacterium TaxID=2212470 RepID=A0ABV6YI30_UNCEI
MIAFTHYDADPRVRREAEALAAAGHRVRVLALRDRGEPAHGELGGVEIFRLPVARKRGSSSASYLGRYGLFFLLSLLHTSMAFVGGKIDTVHVHTMPDFLVFAALLPRIFGRKVILDVHDMMPELFGAKFRAGDKSLAVRLLKLQENLSTRFANRVIAVHDPHRDVLLARNTHPHKTEVIMNLPDERIFSRNGHASRPHEETPRPERPATYNIVYHGTLAPRHGVDTAIRACDIARRELPGLRLRVIGDGDDRQALLDLTQRKGLEDVVSFSEGAVPVDRLPDLLTGTDLGLVPSRVDPSTDLMLPSKLMEYLQLGIPVVCSPLRVVRHYFSDDGLTYAEPGNPSSWAAAILRHARDPRLGAEQIARCDAFLARHSWDCEKQKLLALHGPNS